MSRRDIYYWKCDRPAAFHGTERRGESQSLLATPLHEALREHFHTNEVTLAPGVGQGNHLTWNAEVAGLPMFVRVENGPEGDDHLAVESEILDRVRESGVPTPCVHGCDASRRSVPFAWQALEQIPAPDLNHWFKLGNLEMPGIAFDIGQAVAGWQTLTFDGFGILEWPAQSSVRQGGRETLAPHRGLCGPLLCGSRATYTDYFHLRLDEHLAFLVSRGFLTTTQRDEIAAEIEIHHALLDLAPGCLVHKDLALWNILGTQNRISAFIDFDDAISGDLMDDLSLLACFHDEVFLRWSFEGYQSVRPLPADAMRRFWLHLLRNMIVKAVIRVGAGYFDRDSAFFLIGSGSSGASLRETTHNRLALAIQGLREDSDLHLLTP